MKPHKLLQNSNFVSVPRRPLMSHIEVKISSEYSENLQILRCYRCQAKFHLGRIILQSFNSRHPIVTEISLIRII